MTKFIRTRFSYHGGYLHYDGKFVARFKYRTAPVNKTKFLQELTKNHTVEDYFARMEAGETPIGILKKDNPEWHQNIMNKFYNR